MKTRLLASLRLENHRQPRRGGQGAAACGPLSSAFVTLTTLEARAGAWLGRRDPAPLGPAPSEARHALHFLPWAHSLWPRNMKPSWQALGKAGPLLCKDGAKSPPGQKLWGPPGAKFLALVSGWCLAFPHL